MSDSIAVQVELAHQRGELRRALELCEEELEHGGGKLPPRELHQLWILKSHCLNALGRWSEALIALESANQDYGLDAESIARLAMHKGYLMGSLTRYADCWSLLHQAEQAALGLGLKILLAEVLWRRGIILVFAGQHTEAENCLRSALEISIAEKNRRLQGLATAGLAKNLVYLDQHAEALPMFEEALTIFTQLEDRFYSAIIWCESANCHLHLGEPEKALEMFKRAEQIFEDSGAVANYQVCLANIGNVYLYRREFLSAISYYEQALELARQLNDRFSIGRWLRNLAQAYSCLGNPALARGFENEANLVNTHLAEERERAARMAASLK